MFLLIKSAQSIQKIIRELSTRGITPANQISLRTAQILRNLGISFSSTIDLRKKPSDPTSKAYIKGVTSYRKFLRNDPDLIQREIVNWNLLDQEKTSSPFYLDDQRTHLHLQFLFDREDQLIFVNLSNPQVNYQIRKLDSRVYSFLKGHLGLGSISFHLGFAAEELQKDLDDGHSIPRSEILTREEIKYRLLTTLNAFKKNVRSIGYRGPLLVETLDYQEDGGLSAYSHVTDPIFVKKVLNETGYGLLLDPAHLVITAMNRGYVNPLDYAKELIEEVDLRLLQEIHLSVPERGTHRWLDNHRSFCKNIDTEEAKLTLELFGTLLLKRLEIPGKTSLIVNFESPIEYPPQDLKIVIDFIEKVLSFKN